MLRAAGIRGASQCGASQCEDRDGRLFSSASFVPSRAAGPLGRGFGKSGASPRVGMAPPGFVPLPRPSASKAPGGSPQKSSSLSSLQARLRKPASAGAVVATANTGLGAKASTGLGAKSAGPPPNVSSPKAPIGAKKRKLQDPNAPEVPAGPPPAQKANKQTVPAVGEAALPGANAAAAGTTRKDPLDWGAGEGGSGSGRAKTSLLGLLFVRFWALGLVGRCGRRQPLPEQSARAHGHLLLSQ